MKAIRLHFTLLLFSLGTMVLLAAAPTPATASSLLESAGYSCYANLPEPTAWTVSAHRNVSEIPVDRLGLALAMLLLSRSLQPLAQLVRGVREDWTRLSFALYGAVAWLMLAVIFDSKGWYNDSRYLFLNLLALTLIFSAGALLYMQQRPGWRRVLALQVPLFLVFPLEWLAKGVDGSSDQFSSTALGALVYLLLIALWVTPPLWPGLAQMVHGRLRGT